LELKNLTKCYDEKIIFSNINYIFESGQVYWIKGENGVGKSTFIRMILGVDSITRGDIENIPIKKLYIPEVELCEKWLTINENIRFLYDIAGVTKDQEISLDEELNIKDFNTLSMECSTGTNMKVGFSLIYASEKWDIIIIDEALAHIDLDTQRKIIKKLIELSKRDGTIVILTHHDDIVSNDSKYINKLIMKKDGFYEER